MFQNVALKVYGKNSNKTEESYIGLMNKWLDEDGRLGKEAFNTIFSYLHLELKKALREKGDVKIDSISSYVFATKQYPNLSVNNLCVIEQYAKGFLRTSKNNSSPGNELLSGERNRPLQVKKMVFLDDNNYFLCETQNHYLLLFYRFTKKWRVLKLDGFVGRNRDIIQIALADHIFSIRVDDMTSLSSDLQLADSKINSLKDVLKRYDCEIKPSEARKPQLTITEGRDGWYVNFPIKLEEPEPIDPVGCIGVDIGIVRFVQWAMYKPSKGYNFFNHEWHHDKKDWSVDWDYILHKREIREKIREAKKAGVSVFFRRGHGVERRSLPMRSLSISDSGMQKSFSWAVARMILLKAKKEKCIIAIESLNGLNSGGVVNKHYQYSKFLFYLKHLADKEGIPVVELKKYTSGTSQRCSMCGYYPDKKAGEKSRLDQATFVCPNCGYDANADYNAARNIAFLGWAIYKGMLKFSSKMTLKERDQKIQDLYLQAKGIKTNRRALTRKVLFENCVEV